MFCAVYRLRSRGLKLERDVVQRQCSRGELVFMQRLHDPRPGRSVLMAMLVGADGESYVIPVLDRARVTQIRGKGVLIAGIELQPRGRSVKNIQADRYRQTWWCVPQPVPLHDARGPTPAGRDQKP